MTRPGLFASLAFLCVAAFIVWRTWEADGPMQMPVPQFTQIPIPSPVPQFTQLPWPVTPTVTPWVAHFVTPKPTIQPCPPVEGASALCQPAEPTKTPPPTMTPIICVTATPVPPTPVDVRPCWWPTPRPVTSDALVSPANTYDVARVATDTATWPTMVPTPMPTEAERGER
jgi:hypothetical protein